MMEAGLGSMAQGKRIGPTSGSGRRESGIVARLGLALGQDARYIGCGPGHGPPGGAEADDVKFVAPIQVGPPTTFRLRRGAWAAAPVNPGITL